MNILSIDYGDARIGLAYSESEVKVALPLKVLRNTGTFWDELQSVIEEYSITKILVGLPINLNSHDTIQTQKVRDFEGKLRTLFSGEIIFVDERMTSALAKRYIDKTQSVDIESARILLEEWLEKHNT
jgi:putative Holliday junction resolvase